MARRPPLDPPDQGDLLDPDRFWPGWPAPRPEPAAGAGGAHAQAHDHAQTQADERVFDALCIAAAPRGRNWLYQFLRGIGWRWPGADRQIAQEEVQASLHRLRDQGRAALASRNQGWEVPAAAWAARWPALRAHPDAARFWRVWAWATAGANGPPERAPVWVQVRSVSETAGFIRLVLLSHPDFDTLQRVLASALHHLPDPDALLAALTQPWDAGWLGQLPPGLLWSLIAWLHDEEALQDSPELMTWLDARPDAATHLPGLLPVLAERRLHRGDETGLRELLARDAMAPATRAAFEAAWLARAGRWGEAGPAFAAALKGLAADSRQRRGLLPRGLAQWHLYALLARPEAAAWTAARRFAVAESGRRSPDPMEPWGLFVHAAAVRLGDATLDPEAFSAPDPRWRHELGSEDADRVILAAWLGVAPKGWNATTLQALSDALHRASLPWKADLLAQACEHLDWPPPTRPAGAPPAWAPAWYGARQAPWQQALAAIGALDDHKAQPAAAPLLHWQLAVDKLGRPRDLLAFERLNGTRAGARLKALSLTALKRRAALDTHDAAVARCLRAASWDARALSLDLAAATVALIGHGDVALADAPEQAVQLVEGRPGVEWQRIGDAFRLRVDEPLLDDPPPALDAHAVGIERQAELARRNAVRVVRDSERQARVLRVSPAQRRVAELAAQDWRVPASAEAELEATLAVLARHFTLHSDARGGREVAAEPRLVAQLAPRGDALQLRVGVRPFGGFGPLLPAGSGRPRLVTLHGGESLATERDLAGERSHLAALRDALPFLGDDAGDGVWDLDDPELALAAVDALGRLPAVAAVEWPQGQSLRLLTPPQPPAFQVRSGRDWFALDGTLAVDESRVLTLRELLALWAEAGGGRWLPLAPGQWLALGERLRQQLAELHALAEVHDDSLRLPAAAAAWLADLGEQQAPSGDAAWRRRLARLAEAAALRPDPPAALQATLRPYQAEGLGWLVRLAHAGFGGILADDMGLGKTLQTLALLLCRAGHGPALVVAPTSVVANWADEARRFAPTLQVREFAGDDRAAVLASPGAGDLVLASYGLLLREIEAFAAVPWSTLVLDEAQALKNASTQRAKAVAALQADARFALTGTPVENRLADLWSLMNLLNPGLLGSERRFAERFAGPVERQQDAAARARLRRLLAPFLLRRTKAQVLAELPPRTETVWRVEPDADERAVLEALRRQAQERVAAARGPQRAFQVLTELTRLRRAACDPRLVVPALDRPGAKLRAFAALMTELAAGGHRALVFSQFTDFLDLLGQALDAAGLSHLRLDGSTPAPARAARVAAFQRGEGQAFLISLKAGGFGLNLTAADYVVIADPWWNPAAEDQATGRAHRIGQARPVTVYRLVTAGSVEERIVALHHDKRALADGLLEGQDGAAPLDAEALLELLRG